MNLFLFTLGSYDSYYVSGLFSCDHVVSNDEWKAFAEAHNKESSALREEWGMCQDKEAGYKAYASFCAKSAVDRFAEKHNMVEVGYTELNEED